MVEAKAPRKKRATKAKPALEVQPEQNTVDDNRPPNLEFSIEETPPPKKRGRKPKGGKIIPQPDVSQHSTKPVSNVILHLKCSLKDIEEPDCSAAAKCDPHEYNPDLQRHLVAYQDDTKMQYDYINKDNKNEYAYANEEYAATSNNVCTSCCKIQPGALFRGTLCIECYNKQENNVSTNEAGQEMNVSNKELNLKLKELKISLYKGQQHDKKSACFWCTYEYDNPPCYIPRHEVEGEVCGYGSFCRPECASAFLMKENIDDSIKFERYHLLNKVYGKVYNYDRNIRPAPDPHYLLDKFYGNLSIQEYRKLLNSDHILLVIDKPMTRILPELHEDTEDHASSTGTIMKKQTNTGVYKVKRQSETAKGPSKTTIMKERFGMK